MDAQHTGGDLDEIARDECLGLLACRQFGRVAVVVEGQPAIFPVNYALDHDRVVFRTDPGTKLRYAGLGPVAFEIDEIDPVSHEGWSVVVTGLGREITGALDEASEREQSLPLVPWVSGPKEHWIRVVSPVITGRRLRHGIAARQPAGGDGRQGSSQPHG